MLAGGWIKMLSYSSIFQFQCLSYIIVISEMIVKLHAQNSSPRMFLFSNTLPSLSTPLAPNTTPQCRDKYTCSWGTGTGELACRPLGLLSSAHPYTLSLLCLSVRVTNHLKLSIVTQLLHDARGFCGPET